MKALSSALAIGIALIVACPRIAEAQLDVMISAGFYQAYATLGCVGTDQRYGWGAAQPTSAGTDIGAPVSRYVLSPDTM